MSNANHRTLIGHCAAVIDTFNPDAEALEQHVASYLKAQKGLEENEEVFITEVFSGCIRYSAVLNVVTKGFYNRDGRSVLRSLESTFKVFTYLALFRLDELGVGHYGKFVRSMEVHKMFKFLSFFFDDRNLHTWIKDEWMRLYEITFVQTLLLSPLIRWLPELQEIVGQLKKKIDNKVKVKKTVREPTQPEPFNLTQRRPRSIPVPEMIPILKPHNPVPETTYKEPAEIQFLEKVKAANRRRAEEHLMEAVNSSFACANPEKSEKTKNKIQKILDDEDQKLSFESHRSHPIPHEILNDNIPIKLNAATILREGKLYKEREGKLLKEIEHLEAGGKDGSEFREWQNRMKKMDLDQKLADIERRRLEGKLSHEDAILAKQNLIKENKMRVKEMKEEARHLMQQYLQKKMKEEEDNRKLVENVLDTHENAKLAKKRLTEYKAGIVAQMTAESREMMRQALEEAEEEMRQKMDLIREIRAMEAVPVNRNKLVDFAKTAGYGLLSEMSLAELSERLSLLRVRQKEEEDQTRDDILAAKQAKDQMLLDTLHTISRHRTESSKRAAFKFEKRKVTRDQKAEVKDPRVIELQQKLEEKREQRKKEQESARIMPNFKSAKRLKELDAAKKLMEENRWKELEQTRERTAKLATHGMLDKGTGRMDSRTLVMSGY